MSEKIDFECTSSGPVRSMRNGFHIRIGFTRSDGPCADLSVSDYRDELLQLIEVPECATVIFDLTGISAPPSGLVGLLASAIDRGRDVEVRNPSVEVQEILRMAQLDSCLLIRSTTS
jgi:hypothetical protein